MSAKAGKSKPVVLKLSPALLRTFPHEPASTPAESKSISSPDAPSVPQIVESAVDTPADADSASAMNGTSTPSSLAPPAAGPKKKGPAPKKRKEPPADGANGVNGASGAGTPKPRGKPGPKKKQKLGDMINDPNSKSPFAAPAPVAKLGPKANQGAINANLRSLDRTGKFKVRKWVKKGLALRSFTGVVWTVPSYTAPQRSTAFSEDVKSDSTGSSDTKLKDESSAISEKSGMNGIGSSAPTPMNDMASSPAPIAAGS